MASIKPYKTAKGRAWRVQYRSPDGHSRTKQGFRTKSEAEAWAAENTTSINRGAWINPTSGNTTLETVGNTWLECQTHLKPSTYRVTEQVWRNHVKPRWGTTRIAAIRTSEVQAWLSKIDLSASMVRKAHACLAQILDTAVADQLIASNPARGVKLPPRKKGKHVYLTPEQLRTLASECSKNSELVWLLGTVGLRWGEAAALRVQDVNFLRGRISVERNAVTVGYEIKMGTPKTHERRVVAVPSAVLDMLRPLTKDKLPSALLWARSDGTPLRVPAKDDWYYGALQRCMDRDPDFPRVTPHGLRHVAAGLLVSAGANVKVVQRQLGHASAVMTLDTYADLFDGDLDEVAGAMNAVLSRVV